MGQSMDVQKGGANSLPCASLCPESLAHATVTRWRVSLMVHSSNCFPEVSTIHPSDKAGSPKFMGPRRLNPGIEPVLLSCSTHNASADNSVSGSQHRVPPAGLSSCLPVASCHSSHKQDKQTGGT